MTSTTFFAVRLAAAVGMAAAGSLLAISFKKISHKGLCMLISFAAGALLAVTFIDLIPEAMELVGFKAGVVSVLSGYFLFFGINRFFFHICPACSATHTEVKFKAVTAAMVAALAVHSFMDGLAIYSGYLTASGAGILILLAVAFHKFPEGMALTLVARASGMFPLKALALTVLLEAGTTIAGGVAGFLFLQSSSPDWVGYIFGHIGGGFVFLVIHALLSEEIKHHPQSTLLAALAGALSIAGAGFLVGAF